MCMSLGSLEIVQELVDGGLERRQRQLRQLCVLARVEATRVYNIINIILIAKQFLEKDAFVTLSYVHADGHVSITKDVVIINILVVAIKSPSSSHVIAHCPLSHNRQVFTFVINRHFWRLVITFHICPYLSLLEAFPPTPAFTSGLPGPAVSGLNNKSILSS